MAESLKNQRAAYRKGVKAGESGIRYPQCPYDIQYKPELVHWWLAGLRDAKEGKVDETFFKTA